MTVSRARRVDADDSPGITKAIEEGDPGIDEVPRGTDFKKLFSDEAFMNDWVTIVLQPTQDSSEIGVPVSVNGRRAYIIPGRPTKVRRIHIAQLVKARPDIVTHRSDDVNVPERELNLMFRQSTSRYNFDVIEDTVQGAAWLRELRVHYLQK